MKIENFSDIESPEKATKNNIWPLPDKFERDLLVEFCIDRIRAAMRSKSRDSDINSIRKFFDEVVAIRDLTDSCETKEDVIKVVERLNNREFPNAVYRIINPETFTEENMIKHHFGMSKEERLEYDASRAIYLITPSEYKIINEKFYYDDKDGKTKKLDIDKDCNALGNEKGKISALVSDGKIIKFGATQEEYENAVESYKQKRRTTRKSIAKPKRVKRTTIDNVERRGMDFLGDRTIEDDEFSDFFGFTDSVFGNRQRIRSWQRFMNTAHLSFCDLCLALEISPKDITGEELSISLGARGFGKGKGHYDKEKKLLHISRKNGGGVLAENWFHALDHRLSSLFNVYDRYYSAEKGEIKSLNALIDYLNEYNVFYTSKLRNDSVAIDRYEGREEPLWNTIPDLLSRAFSAYVIDKLADLGFKNDFLAYEFDGIEINGKQVSLYPEGEDREKFNELFDYLFDELKTRGILHELRIHDLSIKK